MFKLNDSFYRPLWIRVTIVVVILLWTLVELATGSIGWAMIWGALLVYSGYSFFFNFNPEDGEKDK